MKVVSKEAERLVLKAAFGKEEKVLIEDIVFLERRMSRSTNLWSIFPVLEKSERNDGALTCLELRHELVRVDVLRRAINKEISALNWEMLNTALGLQIHDQPRSQLESDKKARDAASNRMIRLLEMIGDKSCDSEAISLGELDVIAALSEIEQLDHRREAGLSEGEIYETEVKKILDSLKINSYHKDTG